MAIRIRRLRLSDHPVFLQLLDVSGLPPRRGGRDSRAAFARQLRSNRAWYLGAFDGEKLVAAVLGTHDTRKGWINRLAVHPAYRRQGIAARLVKACERSLRSAGIEMFAALIEHGNEGSVAFFRSLGYETFDLTYARKKLREDV